VSVRSVSLVAIAPAGGHDFVSCGAPFLRFSTEPHGPKSATQSWTPNSVDEGCAASLGSHVSVSRSFGLTGLVGTTSSYWYIGYDALDAAGRIVDRTRCAPERGRGGVVRRPDDRDRERLRERARDRVRVRGGELAPGAIGAHERPKRAHRGLAPLLVAGERGEAQQPVGGQGVVFDRLLA